MTRLFNESGEVVPVTILKYDTCVVTDVKTPEKHGYSAVQLSAGDVKTKNLTAADRGRFAKNKLAARRLSREFRVENSADYALGQELAVSHFVPGQKIDVTAVSQGKGFAGVMKRHNFSGLRASHGVSISHRSHGSTGQCQDPGRVFKGKKMAGQMGNTQVTKQNLLIQHIDPENNLIMILGSIPGPKNQYVTLRDAVKGSGVESLPYPGSFLGDKPLDNETADEAQQPTQAAPAEEAAPVEATEDKSE